MKFLLIPPGEFDMGTSKEEVARLLRQVEAQNLPKWYRELLSSEVPKHRVRITKAFYLGMNEVTQVEYERVMAGDRSRLKDNLKHPAPHLTWERAVEFCRALRELPEEKNSRADYRLPTEAEWEYACRAGTMTDFYFGNDQAELDKYVWYGPNSSGRPHPVGQKMPNAWGLYDLHGNVWEWCQDWYYWGYYMCSPMYDPQGPAEGSKRVIRGGSWSSEASSCGLTGRHAEEPGRMHVNLGFRVAMAAPPVSR